MEKEWWKKAVIYQIYPKSFKDSNGDGVGDLGGIISKLPYLKNLGIDALWLCPVYLSPQIDNGYDITDYRTIDPRFGTNKEMFELIRLAHESNIKIIMDFVANHTSDQSVWFKESQKSKDNYFSDFYIWKDSNATGGVPNNWGSNFGGSAWEWSDKRKQYYLHYYAKEMPDLNWENPLVRQYIYDMMRFWTSKGVDGWRMDVITSISKNQGFPNNLQELSTSNQQNGPRMHEFIHELNQEVLAPMKLMSVGESPDSKAEDAYLLVSPEREELNMIFTFEHMHVDRVKDGENGRWDLKKMDLVALKRILTSWQKSLEKKGWNALYFENHDRARITSRWGNDTIYRYESATAFALILHGLKGTPFVYQGEEIGMTNPNFKIEDYEDIELRGNYQFYVEERKTISKEKFLDAAHKISRDNARTPMQWSEKANAGFTNAKPWFTVNPDYLVVNVEKDLSSKKSVIQFYQKLIELRHTEDILTEGSFELLFPEDSELFIYQRVYRDKTWLIMGNFSEKIREIPDSLKIKLKKGKKILSNYDSSGHLLENLNPYECLLYEVF